MKRWIRFMLLFNILLAVFAGLENDIFQNHLQASKITTDLFNEEESKFSSDSPTPSCQADLNTDDIFGEILKHELPLKSTHLVTWNDHTCLADYQLFQDDLISPASNENYNENHEDSSRSTHVNFSPPESPGKAQSSYLSVLSNEYSGPPKKKRRVSNRFSAQIQHEKPIPSLIESLTEPIDHLALSVCSMTMDYLLLPLQEKRDEQIRGFVMNLYDKQLKKDSPEELLVRKNVIWAFPPVKRILDSLGRLTECLWGLNLRIFHFFGSEKSNVFLSEQSKLLDWWAKEILKGDWLPFPSASSDSKYDKAKQNINLASVKVFLREDLYKKENEIICASLKHQGHGKTVIYEKDFSINKAALHILTSYYKCENVNKWNLLFGEEEFFWNFLGLVRHHYYISLQPSNIPAYRKKLGEKIFPWKQPITEGFQTSALVKNVKKITLKNLSETILRPVHESGRKIHKNAGYYLTLQKKKYIPTYPGSPSLQNVEELNLKAFETEGNHDSWEMSEKTIPLISSMQMRPSVGKIKSDKEELIKSVFLRLKDINLVHLVKETIPNQESMWLVPSEDALLDALKSLSEIIWEMHKIVLQADKISTKKNLLASNQDHLLNWWVNEIMIQKGALIRLDPNASMQQSDQVLNWTYFNTFINEYIHVKDSPKVCTITKTKRNQKSSIHRIDIFQTKVAIDVIDAYYKSKKKHSNNTKTTIMTYYKNFFSKFKRSQ
ncbi:hypothetical protein O181_041638 [Austropuccinia psidii MF-1]|uniref:Uncharacterized protein n=1 Tax=Austropuccinia psidii MF-1 TaxID=1389203 RepID=A0A9Q3HDZ8_9BASI|nr:hypothetical protein [Austropuccinia psidii MF-1]